MPMPVRARYRIGQVVRHFPEAFRGVVIDIDAVFCGTEEQYAALCAGPLAVTPPREQPWYQILVDESQNAAYVPEASILPDGVDEPINHPGIEAHFSAFHHGVYHRRTPLH